MSEPKYVDALRVYKLRKARALKAHWRRHNKGLRPLEPRFPRNGEIKGNSVRDESVAFVCGGAGCHIEISHEHFWTVDLVASDPFKPIGMGSAKDRGAAFAAAVEFAYGFSHGLRKPSDSFWREDDEL